MATEKRLIDANAYVDELKWLQEQVSSASAIEIQEYIDRTNRQPTVDAVEVVRCKDCKHCDPENRHCDHPMGTTFSLPRKTDDYCSYGERKDND